DALANRHYNLKLSISGENYEQDIAFDGGGSALLLRDQRDRPGRFEDDQKLLLEIRFLVDRRPEFRGVEDDQRRDRYERAARRPDAWSSNRDSFALDGQESLPAFHLPVRRTLLETESVNHVRDQQALGVGCRRSLHR